jgi:hypothetical protein
MDSPQPRFPPPPGQEAGFNNGKITLIATAMRVREGNANAPCVTRP